MIWLRARLDSVLAFLRRETKQTELLPHEAWIAMGGDVVRRERGPWPQRVLIVIAAAILMASVWIGVTFIAPPPCDAAATELSPVPVLPTTRVSPSVTPSPTPKPTPTLRPTPAPTPRSPFLGWPLAGRAGTVSCWYSTSHRAIDFAVPTGTRWLASLSGTVVYAGWNGTLGYTVEISTGSPPTAGYPGKTGWFLLYSHGQSAIPVRVGQHVGRGQWIGNADSSGYVTGPHLHFMVAHNGYWQYPWPLLH